MIEEIQKGVVAAVVLSVGILLAWARNKLIAFLEAKTASLQAETASTKSYTAQAGAETIVTAIDQDPATRDLPNPQKKVIALRKAAEHPADITPEQLEAAYADKKLNDAALTAKTAPPNYTNVNADGGAG